MSSERPNRTCYMSALGDCRGKLTREHPVPQSYLKLFESASIVGGVPFWAEPGNPLRLWSSVLCERHNGFLGKSVDKTLKNLLLIMECYDLAEANVRETKKKKQRLVKNAKQTASFDRGLICAAVLKLAEGISAASNAERTPLPLRIAKIISGDAVIDRNYLLYVVSSPSNDRRVSVVPWEEGGQIAGLELKFQYGIGFLVWVGSTSPSLDQIRKHQVECISFVSSGAAYVINDGTDTASVCLICV